MKQLFLLIGVFVTLCCVAQKPVELKDLRNYVGDTVRVCGKVYSGVFVSTVESTPTFLNMGAAYPNQLLTVVIWPDVRDSLKGAPENTMFDKRICVTGKIELYQGKPQIVIKDP